MPPRVQSTVPECSLPQHEPQLNSEVDSTSQIPPHVPPSKAEVAQGFLYASDGSCPPEQLHQPPHPSQVPPPSFPLPEASDHLLSETSSAASQAEASLPPTQPQPESPAPPAFQPQQTHPSHPHLPTMLPPFQSIPGAVPLQQLSQLYQDPLYPGFPQAEKGGVAVTPPCSSNRSGDDLPQGEH